jgi:hypothetical protein
VLLHQVKEARKAQKVVGWQSLARSSGTTIPSRGCSAKTDDVKMAALHLRDTRCRTGVGVLCTDVGVERPLLCVVSSEVRYAEPDRGQHLVVLVPLARMKCTSFGRDLFA